MDVNFQRALPFVLKHEGGYVDHPKDPGGATNKGITIATFRRYIKPDATKQDLRNITDEQVASIYYQHYWCAAQAQNLPSGVDYAVFDFAVNSGPSRAVKFLQRAVGVKDDGRIGPKTLEATAKMPARVVISKICDARLAWLKRLRTWATFGRGWSRRVDGVARDATAMICKPPRTSPAQSSTIRASAAQIATGAGGAVSAVAALDGTAQIVACALAGITVITALWIMRERVRHWAKGVR